MWNLEGLTVRGLYMGSIPVAGRVELEQVDVTKGVLPIHDDVYSVQIHG